MKLRSSVWNATAAVGSDFDAKQTFPLIAAAIVDNTSTRLNSNCQCPSGNRNCALKHKSREMSPLLWMWCRELQPVHLPNLAKSMTEPTLRCHRFYFVLTFVFRNLGIGGHLLLTSRNGNWSSIRVFPVVPLTVAAGYEPIQWQRGQKVEWIGNAVILVGNYCF